MREFVTLSKGDLIEIISDVTEFERLCERPAPGSDDCVNFNEDMQSLCGRVWSVESVCHSKRAYIVIDEHNDDWMVPFDACILRQRRR